MKGLMQDWPLLLHRIIDHAAIFHGGRQVISRSVEGPFHTTNYREVRERALKVSQRLAKDGIKLGDRVATLSWNHQAHLEAYLARRVDRGEPLWGLYPPSESTRAQYRDWVAANRPPIE